MTPSAHLQMLWKSCLVAALLAASLAPARAGTLAQFRTVLGDIEVELFDQDKPITVANFKRYVESGRWAEMFAHRLDPGFVLQGGGYRVEGRAGPNPVIEAVPRYDPVPNEFGVGPRLSNVFGTVAMAKVGGNTNSANAEWFINLGNNTFLDAATSDGFFTVFGQVVRGSNVLHALNSFAYYTGPASRPTNVIANFGSPLNELPLLRTNATFADLLFVDVTLLRVSVARSAEGAAIAWDSVASRTNCVQFSRSLPPVWEDLVRTNGSGARMEVRDPTPPALFRFYRVRIMY